jgi:hypothetical protein
MQTFLPYSDFLKSAQVLDWRRLGKQRVEARQIYNSIRTNNSWRKHPAVKMWVGYEDALQVYGDVMIIEWKRRGFNNNMSLSGVAIDSVEFPWWFGEDRFHAAHRSNLLRKDKGFYGKLGWTESDDLCYFWPC